MRRLIPLLLAASIAVAGGCGTEATAPPTGTATTGSASPMATVEAYAVLVRNVNGFMEAAKDASEQHPEAVPQTSEELLALTDYVFRDGVSLQEYDDPGSHICFTGPQDTYLALTEVDHDLRRILGTGDCDYSDGEIVLTYRLTRDVDGFTWSEHVDKGQDLAEQVPGLDEFVDVINDDSGESGSDRSGTDSASTMTTVEAYAVLVRNVNGFFRAAKAAEEQHPETVPATVDEVLELTDYVFHDGVALVEYDLSESQVCFTGPQGTYLALTEVDHDLRRMLGTGGCDYGDGEIVLVYGLAEDAPGFRLRERVVKGQDLAEQVPGLDEFAEIINAD